MKENNSMWFTFKNGAKLLAETPLMVLASIHEMCRKSSAGCLPMITHVDMVPNYFHFSFFLGTVFYMQWLRSGTDLITYESELHGWVSRMACSINGSPPRWVAHRYLHSDSCIFFASVHTHHDTYTNYAIYAIYVQYVPELTLVTAVCPVTLMTTAVELHLWLILFCLYKMQILLLVWCKMPVWAQQSIHKLGTICTICKLYTICKVYILIDPQVSKLHIMFYLHIWDPNLLMDSDPSTGEGHGFKYAKNT